MKNICILGSTGAVGRAALNVVRSSKNYKVAALAAKSNIGLLEEQIKEFSPEIVAVFDEEKAKELRRRCNIKVVSSLRGISEVATIAGVDLVLVAISGSIALLPTIEAMKAGKVIGLANKEVLVAAGKLINRLVKKHKTTLIPIDSEHSAIFQCLKNEDINSVKRLILTCSGGPLLNSSKEALEKITLKEVLKHPTYSMGREITVNCSTLMNKGLEIIEAFYLFNIDKQNIDAVIHPQSIIHSFVEFIDGSILAQISEPNMEIPIRYALGYPKREKSNIKKFDFVKNNKLTFYDVDMDKFRCLALAMEALKAEKSMPCFMNKANEVLVQRFLNKEISWLDISKKLESLMSSHTAQELLDLDTILEVEKEASKKAEEI